MDDWFSTISWIGTNDDFVPPYNWEDLFKFDQLNLLVDWDPIHDGPLPELALKWLSEQEIQDWNSR
eukprot:4862012-Ditylum_brightwellii.AAC.3